MSQLRDRENGCEWDKGQTFESIAPYTIEEAYEVADAIDRGNIPDLKEELGDLLLQVVFLSQIAEEEELFSFEDVAESISQKLVRRHPYVFSDQKDHTAKDQVTKWEEIKIKERSKKNQINTLDGIAKNMPALKRSQKLQKRASKAGFDWPDTKGVFEKIREETLELEEAVKSDDKELMVDEIGDLLMVVTNLAQKMNIDSEEALKQANKKFTFRFSYVEEELRKQKKEVSDTNLEELDSLWDESKKLR